MQQELSAEERAKLAAKIHNEKMKLIGATLSRGGAIITTGGIGLLYATPEGQSFPLLGWVMASVGIIVIWSGVDVLGSMRSEDGK